VLIVSVPLIAAGVTTALILFSKLVFRHGKRFPEL
jgi:hypothetical protein